MPGGLNRYWETIPNQVYQGKYRIKIVPCRQADVVEIDTFEELKQIDKSYL
jgi:CTP:phosphocholine cytidylyltransferase-like protein